MVLAAVTRYLTDAVYGRRGLVLAHGRVCYDRDGVDARV